MLCLSLAASFPFWEFLREVKEDTIFSATMCQLLAQSLTEKHNCVGAAELHGIESSSSQFLKAKMVLMQTKRLVFDCVKEAIDTHGRRARRQKRLKGVLGPEELGKKCVTKSMNGEINLVMKQM